MRCTGVRINHSLLREFQKTDQPRIHAILPSSRRVFDRYDLQSRTGVWQEESSHLYLDLLNRGINLSHVGQSLRNCAEVDHGW